MEQTGFVQRSETQTNLGRVLFVYSRDHHSFFGLNNVSRLPVKCEKQNALIYFI